MSEYKNTIARAIVAAAINEMNKFDMAATAWQSLSDEERQTRTNGMLERADTLAETLITAMEEQGQVSVSAKVESVVFKGAIKATLEIIGNEPHRHELSDIAGGGRVTILLPQRVLDLEEGETEDDAQGDLLDEAAEPVWTPSDVPASAETLVELVAGMGYTEENQAADIVNALAQCCQISGTTLDAIADVIAASITSGRVDPSCLTALDTVCPALMGFVFKHLETTFNEWHDEAENGSATTDDLIQAIVESQGPIAVAYGDWQQSQGEDDAAEEGA